MVMPTRVFVILFNARTDNEGIHSLKIDDRDVVLMFEQEDDATRFAMMLEAQDLPPATVEAIDTEEIEEFCRSAGYEAKLIEVGMLAVPPETNVEITDWQLDAQDKQEPEIPDLDRIRRQLEGLL
ncbi:MAG: DUF3110 domain-containing protein [Symploca sp. SIO3C6]|uniref:DUF3110 domain-containing protein n=1 Tax=Symploca sp. SIO1C4 TaxID=2607765 RepID=A0A6B3NDH1_9CYAN|nr:DUF3110 domain-containing protein [Symploca sp. SIO3C6]NER31149.1 DUF3110 domain-containing protein [Symploca sp. SIO1C4]NET07501.1 DUF3110 domain-containing protein [Symploca sp. SIO2B6]